MLQNPTAIINNALSNQARDNILKGVKNHRFFPLVYLSSKAFFTVFFASSL